jgi:hypothetical protein
MTENTQIQISDSNKLGVTPMITDRPFFRSADSFNDDELRQLEERGLTVEDLRYPLGFSEQDLSTWKEKNYNLLEIGPGEGISYMWLKDQGYNIRAIEPALRFDDDEEFAVKAKANLGADMEAGLVSSANAVDAADAFPDTKFDVAFAVGPNFQTYAPSEPAFYAQMAGIMEALKPEEQSYLVFEILDETGEVEVNRRDIVNLKEKLEEVGVKYEIVRSNGTDYAIRVYRLDANGEDSLQKFKQFLKE